MSQKTAGLPVIIVRVILGVVLIWKAINFIFDMSVLDTSVFTGNEASLGLVMSILTFVCGIFIIAGLFTRIAAVIQLPIVVIAALFIHAGYIDRSGFELMLTLAIPFVLLYFITKDSKRNQLHLK